MSENAYLAAAVATAASVTFALRAVPFALLQPLRGSALAAYLAQHMPTGIMVILVASLLKDVSLSHAPHGLPEAVGLLSTAGLHLCRGNAVLSILSGTALYVVLVNLVV